MGNEERRRFPRLPLDTEIVYRVLDQTEAELYTTGCKNISSGGLCIIVIEKLEREAVLNLKFSLPTIIISSRAVLKSVPPSIREAALGVGASRVQMMFHHVLPQALPGMLTGAIIGMSQALGESAPLLMIGMVAFIVDVPTGFFDPSTVLPVQIFLWADSPERAFVEKTSAAIIVLLVFLVLMNATAIYLRKKYEKKW